MLHMGQVYANCVSFPNNKMKQIGITRSVTINCLIILKNNQKQSQKTFIYRNI